MKTKLFFAASLLAATGLVGAARADAALTGCFAAPINGGTQVTAGCTGYNSAPVEPNRVSARGYCTGVNVGWKFGPWVPYGQSTTTPTCFGGPMTAWGYRLG